MIQHLAAKSEPRFSDLKLAENLKRFMDNRRLNEAELARQTNIPQPTLHKILSGKTIDPRASTLKLLANFFSVSLDDLFSGNLSQTNNMHHMQKLPILSWTACLDAKNVIATINEENWDKWIINEFIAATAFALPGKATMEPRFARDTIFLIDPEATPTCSDLVILKFPNCFEATMREFICDGPMVILQPLCPSRQSDKLTPEIQILGVVVKTILNLR